jgi:D-xylose transport system permease protein
MSETTVTSSEPARAMEGRVTRFMRQTEIDTRLLGMIGALVFIWIGFHLYGAIINGFGAFLTPRNLWNLSVQTASISIMSTGMVLVIVTRNIDLSVGSVLGFTAMIMGVTQTVFLPKLLGLGNPAIWIIAVIVGIALGALIGAFQGFIIAYLEVPSFIVTLGGLLVWRGAAWWVARGQTIAPLDSTFKLMGGGPYGAVGATASWIIGIIGCAGILFMMFLGRRQRVRFGFPLRPLWAETVIAALGCGATLGAVIVANAYPWPIGIVRRYAQAHNITIPEGGLFISHGFAIPVLLAVAAGIVMTFLATRTKFGRYVFAIGGNPEAAELAGINTKRVTMMVFAVMGMLCAVSGVISSARLDSATNALGTLDELYVIAAAVIGGTSFAGGMGTIYGAMLGAVVMQSLQSGMVLIGVESAIQQMVVGGVLVFAVFIDTIYRKRAR